MLFRTAGALCLSVLVSSPCGAAAPNAVDSPATAADSPNRPGTEPATDGDGWIELIPDNGPVGIERVGRNMKLCGDVSLPPESLGLVAQPGSGVVAMLTKPDYGDDNNLVGKQEFGDCEVELEFLMGKDSNSGIKLQERYEIQLFDSHGREQPTARDCGGIYPHWVFRADGSGLDYIDKGVPPTSNAAKRAGEWQSLRIVFRAPRFDREGKKTANARFESVLLNGQEVQHDVEVDSPTGNASSPLPEVARAPLFLQMDHGPVAFRNVRVRPLDEPLKSPAAAD